MRQLKITKQVTNRDLPSLDKYLQDIGKELMINPNDEVELAKRIREGDAQALDTLIRANLRFVVSVSKQYQNQGLTLSDLINEGNIGLIKAAHRFDETKGFKFISYAVWWIRQSILQALAEQSRMVRLPLNKIGAMNKINRAATILEQRLNRPPNDDEIAIELNMDVKEVKNANLGGIRHVSIDAPLVVGEEGSLSEVLLNDNATHPDEDLLYESLCNEIERILRHLNEREAEILRLYYGLNGNLPNSLDEIAEKFDLTRERVRQIKEKAIQRMRSSSRNRLLRKYLG